MPEHPTFRALAHGFASELGPSLPQPLLPELLVNFTVRAELELRQQRATHGRGAAVPKLTAEHAGAPQPSTASLSLPRLTAARSAAGSVRSVRL